MKTVIAPDSFKECLDAARVAWIIADELRQMCPGAETVCCPLSDGGEGFTEIMTEAMGGKLVPLTATGPLGERVDSAYGRVGNTAVFGVSSFCGLQLVPPELRNPMKTTSRGVGEAVLAAYGNGCDRFVVGVGGTATCDGGAGMMSVPGIKDLRGRITVEVLSDVEIPLLGPLGSVRVYAPQKGADAAMLVVLEAKMRRHAAEVLAETGFDMSLEPGTGAGGGLAGALMAYFGGTARYGVDAVLDMVGFPSLIEGADLIITGEGRSDRQTLSGKAPLGVLRHAMGCPVVLLSGAVEDREELLAAGFFAVYEVTPRGTPLEHALNPAVAERNLREAVRSLIGRHANLLR